MQLDLEGKVVVVTGAGRGIGRAIAETFLRERSTVVATDLDDDALSWFEPARVEAGLDGAPVVCDVRSTESVRTAISQVVDLFGRIDVLVNNAGILGKARSRPPTPRPGTRCSRSTSQARSGPARP